MLIIGQLSLEGHLEYAEVEYYFIAKMIDAMGVMQSRPLALVSLYSPPNLELLEMSERTLWACEYQGERAFRVVDTTCILAVVGMVPFSAFPGQVFVAEKLGLDVDDLGGFEEIVREEE
jgi:hypothetical protein